MNQLYFLSLLQDFVSLFYPTVCAACGNSLYQNEETICLFCQHHLPKTNFHTDPDNPLAKVFWGRVNLENVSALYYFTKAGKVQHLLHLLKYKNRKDIGRFLGMIYGPELSETPNYSDISMIIPVPLHPDKQRRRGYNQSEQFALGLSASIKIPLVNDILIRTHSSETQTRKSRFSRWENVEQIFMVTNHKRITDQHILLVDDVITTGATIEACANRLLENGLTKVSVASIACTFS